MKRERLAILGASGSIGASTLDVVSRHPERFEVVALTALRRWEALLEACRRFQPRWAVLGEADAADALRAALRREGIPTEVRQGETALAEVASHRDVDTVVAAIVGAAGLPPAWAAVCAGKKILLANKEALVLAGGLFMEAVAQHGARLLPLDSEHNAIFQALPPDYDRSRPDDFGVQRIILTASGGPFRGRPLERFATVTPQEACAHPNWSMGRKISVDSATMMNKGLEVIEAYWLFGLPPSRIEVVIHPQSVVHSLVEYRDGSLLAQMGTPDMRTPIAHALGFPQRLEAGVRPLDLVRVRRLEFEPPDLQRFPCLRLAYEALREGGSAPAALNAANEVAVAAFLQGRLRFDRIPALIESTLAQLPLRALDTLEAVLEFDRLARDRAEALLAGEGA
ncbi:MAG: 1-deoxy-D-xylulose-5-phosphate reductoisomerase [Rhodocyclales bacterium]|nr:1-deoxy-D-xylulose-5-phosphate reductoisomerase [Rhodocyclales bacterium]